MPTEKAPGLIWRTRRHGPPVAYWIARRDLVKAGYRPKTVRLHGEPDVVAARCRVLQAEMLAWSVDRRGVLGMTYDGTFASLGRLYETHQDSPYRELRPATQRTYSKTLALLMVHKGRRRVDAVDASDVRRWYKELTEASSKSWAYYTISVLKAALSFGSTKRLSDCRLLRAELRDARFGGGAKRQEYLTHAQVIAFRDAARGTADEWMALCLLLQFELGLRRRDVIGEYVQEPGVDGIRLRGCVWRDGVTWGDIDTYGVFKRLVSKTSHTSAEMAVHAIADYPDLAAELRSIPAERRIGPIVINPKTGRPPTEAQCRRAFRRIARKCGIPDAVWNMDARAGANTEAFSAGATQEERMALLTHAEPATNEGYIRERLKQARAAAKKRVDSR